VPSLLENLTGLLGSRLRLSHQAASSGFKPAALGSRAEKACPDVNQQAIRTTNRTRNVYDLNAAVPQSLCYLLHVLG
jgi:hypothetical protein